MRARYLENTCHFSSLRATTFASILWSYSTTLSMSELTLFGTKTSTELLLRTHFGVRGPVVASIPWAKWTKIRTVDSACGYSMTQVPNILLAAASNLEKVKVIGVVYGSWHMESNRLITSKCYEIVWFCALSTPAFAQPPETESAWAPSWAHAEHFSDMLCFVDLIPYSGTE